MSDKNPDPRRDSVSMVGPYARIRIIAAILIVVVAIAFLGVRALGA